MLANVAFIALFLLAAFSVPVVPLMLARSQRFKRSTTLNQSAYEQGLETIGDMWLRFKMHHYLYALVFAVFDVGVLFLYPWVVAYNQLGLFAVIEMLIFIALLTFGVAYVWRKGALERE